ncbi:MAG: glycosyltransferase family 2 protein [Planctomycetes bacterium]|nr:glycosyltransferase family 2 protein [Planctomycetota bacterium]
MSEDKSHYISVVIPAYRCGGVIGRTIESVLGQTRAADEIIVVDDGSGDNTAEVVGRYGEKVRYISQENAGASAARNRGIEAAQGEWIALLDGDDEWLENKLELQMGIVERHPELMWVTGNYLRCLCGVEKRAAELEEVKAGRLLGGKDFFESYFSALAVGAGGWTGTMVIKREALIESGLFRPEQKRANDLDMWWRVAHRWPQIGYTPAPVAIYHLGTPESISQGYFDIELYCELIERHTKLAEEQGRRAEFSVGAKYMIRKWIRGMLFDKRGEDINRLLEQFDKLLDAGYKRKIRIMTVWPGLTAGVLRMISKVVRTFNLRKRAERAPKNIN